MRKFSVILGAAALCFGIVQGAFASTVYPLGFVDSTNGRAVTPNDYGRGYAFSVDSNDVWLTNFAFNTPSDASFSYDIALWNLSTQSRVSFVSSLVGTASAWSTISVAPLALIKGVSYAITLYSKFGALYWSGDSAYLPASNDISFLGAQFCRNCTSNIFPDGRLAGYNYGFVDIGYQIGEPSPVPLPASLPLLGIGFVALAAVRRRRAKVEPCAQLA